GDPFIHYFIQSTESDYLILRVAFSHFARPHTLLVQEARKKELLLHQSAGVGAFKADRGAVGEVEYTAVYVRHLPLSRRIVWRVLSWILLRFGVPLIQKYQL
ncbi:hypothetical protein SAMN05518846_1231, partial [Brevibacillus centrosporus]